MDFLKKDEKVADQKNGEEEQTNKEDKGSKKEDNSMKGSLESNEANSCEELVK